MSAEPPVLALREARIAFGGPPLFEDLSVGLDRRERACLVGRNGSGKSTLLKALAGLVELDAGARFTQPGLRVSYLAQDQTFAAGETVAAFVGTGLAPGPEGPGSEAPGMEDHGSEAGTHQYRVAEILDHLQLAGGRQASELSGGEARRAALARALVGAPEVLLLDEPTNHLDLPTIEWLETYLGTFPGALLVVSHDRAFLTRLSRRTLWLVGGGLRRKDDGFAGFEPWSEKLLADEAKVAVRLDKRLAAEIRWLHHGITARRKRNQGRLHRLQDLRRERAARPRGPITVRLKTGTPSHAGRLVIDAEALTKSFAVTGPGGSPGKDGTRVVVHDFTTRILKGDRVGIVGPNGAGKTTLLRLLTGDLAPDSGQLRLGAGVRLAYFDQHRTALDPAKTLWETLCEAGGDTVFVGTKRRHVVGYLKDFLFKESQAKSPVASLSGGERNRLLLAKILAGRANLMVLDEPTNDLDMDTLDLLQEMLAEYEGTLLLVSHDRDFLDRVVTSIIAVEGDGQVAEYVGGYGDYLRQRPAVAAPSPAARRGGGAGPKKPAAKKAPTGRKPRPQRLGYREQRELAELPDRIEALSREAKQVEARLHDPALYARDRAAFEAAAARSAALRQELAQAEARWLALEARREEIEAAKADGDAARAGPVRPAP